MSGRRVENDDVVMVDPISADSGTASVDDGDVDDDENADDVAENADSILYDAEEVDARRSASAEFPGSASSEPSPSASASSSSSRQRKNNARWTNGDEVTPDPPILPFEGHTGPVIGEAEIVDPISAFTLFFDDDISTHVITMTNRYAHWLLSQQKKPAYMKGFVDVKPRDLRLFWGVLLFMGMFIPFSLLFALRVFLPLTTLSVQACANCRTNRCTGPRMCLGPHLLKVS